MSSAALERGPAAAAFFAVAPLLERHEASAVAAALYELWEAATAVPAAPPQAAASAGASSKLWVGIGKRRRGDASATWSRR